MADANKGNKNNSKTTDSPFGDAFVQGADLALKQVEAAAGAYQQGMDAWLGAMTNTMAGTVESFAPGEMASNDLNEDMKAARGVFDAWHQGTRQLSDLWLKHTVAQARFSADAVHQLAASATPEDFAETQKALTIKGFEKAHGATDEVVKAAIGVADAVAKPAIRRAAEKFS